MVPVWPTARLVLAEPEGVKGMPELEGLPYEPVKPIFQQELSPAIAAEGPR